MSAEDCVGCKHINNCLGDCVGYEKVKPKEQTNFERITASAESLAEFIIDKLQYCKRPVCPICPVWKKCDGNSKESLVEWLKQESNK